LSRKAETPYSQTLGESEMLSPIAWGDTLSGPPVSSGRLLASSPVLVRRWRGVAPDIIQPPIDHHYITLHLGGPKKIRRKGEGREAHNTLDEGCYSVTPAGSAFTWRTEGPVDFAHLYLGPSSFDAIATDFDRDPRQSPLQDALGARDPVIEALVGAAALGSSEHAPLGRLYWDGLLHTLLSRVLHRHSTIGTHSATPTTSLSPRRLQRVVEFMDVNLASDIGLSELSSVACVSESHFSRVFRRATGLAPYAFLMQRRMERAKTLLVETDMPLGEIATACGWRSHSHFSTMFKRAVGSAPGRYRARN